MKRSSTCQIRTMRRNSFKKWRNLAGFHEETDTGVAKLKRKTKGNDGKAYEDTLPIGPNGDHKIRRCLVNKDRKPKYKKTSRPENEHCVSKTTTSTNMNASMNMRKEMLMRKKSVQKPRGLVLEEQIQGISSANHR